jgi:hypothetical protein
MAKAPTAEGEQWMNEVSGQITVKETGVGVSAVLVHVFDVDPKTPPVDDAFARPAGVTEALWEKLQADRIGSVATDPEGRFRLVYDDSAFRVRNAGEVRPDLLLVVTAPEEPGERERGCPEILHVSCGIRANSGRFEGFVIQLPADRLREAGVRVAEASAGAEEPEHVVERLASSAAKRERIVQEVRRIQGTRVDVSQAFANEFTTKLRPTILDAVSRVPSHLRESDGFLKPGDKVDVKTEALVKKGFRERVNAPAKRARVVGFAALSKRDEQRLRDGGFGDGEGPFRHVPGELVKPLLFGRERPSGSSFLMRDEPIARACREKSHEEERCEADLGLGDEPASDADTPAGEAAITGNEDAAGAGVVISSDGRVPVYAARLMNTMTSPEEPVAVGATQPGTRADQDVIQQTIDAFQLRSGPADSPAIYDFHVLQVAFEHVWQEAIDEGILDVAEDAYREVVELGGDPFTDPPHHLPVGVKIDPALRLKAFVSMIRAATRDEPPKEVVRVFEVSPEQWRVLNRELRDELRRLAEGVLEATSATNLGFVVIDTTARERARLREQGEHILRYADALLESGEGSYERLHKLLEDLESRLKQPYSFTTFAVRGSERSINFGLLLEYRVKLEPIAYQVGRLEKTITLTPGEKQVIRKKVVRKVSRSVEDITNSLRARKTEAAETTRVESEVLAKATSKTNFTLSAQGGYQAKVWNVSGSTSFTKDASTESSETKKTFGEAIFKSAEEYKNERTVKITTTEAEDLEAEETAEIRNDNNELPVTFLFYELQRRYRMSQALHRVTPVVLVAEEVPRPEEITRAWLVQHDAVLANSLLNRSYEPALNYLSTQIVGDEIALKEMRRNVNQQRRLIEKIEEELVAIHEQAGRRYAALERSIEQRADAVGGESAEGFAEKAGEWLLGSADDEESTEAARIREDAAHDAYEREAKLEKEARARLEREVTALNAMTEAYTKALSEHLNRLAQVDRLANHVKDNILFYMQAIWSSEVADQRSLRLQKVQVPLLDGATTFSLKKVSKKPLGLGLPHLRKDRAIFQISAESVDVNTDGTPLERVDLVEVADLDNLLGFKWNYLIFPLKESNALTDFMLTPYADAELGLRDPDEFGNWTLQEFADYVCCLKENLPKSKFEKVKDELRDEYKRLLTETSRPFEEVILPGDSPCFYIEALPGVHPVLEDFKLLHRAIDVKSAQADARSKELENVRLAARLLASPQLLEDPTIERKVVVEGDSGVVVPSD